MFRMSRICAAALFAGLFGLAIAQPAAASPFAASQDAVRLASTPTDIEKAQYYGPPRRHWGPPPRGYGRGWGRDRRGRYWGPPPRSRVVCRTVYTDWGPRRVCRPRW